MKAARVSVLAVLLVGCASEPSNGALRLTGVLPDSALEGASVQITIMGEGLRPKVFTDFDAPAESRFELSYTAELGTTSLRQVKLNAEGQLTALVPEGLAPGLYELTVTDPSNRRGTLTGAFRVLSADEHDALIVGYRIEPIAPQHVFTPFAVRITAVDARGEPVPGFNGSASLNDLTSTLVPRATGSFAFGRWAGKVEARAVHAANILTVTDVQQRTGSSNPFAVATSSPAALAFSTPPRTELADRCSAMLSVGLRDGIGVEAIAESDLEVTLSASPDAGFAFFSDADCQRAVAGARITKGTNAVSFHFKGTQAGTVLVTAAASGLSSDTQTAKILASASARLAFVSSPRLVTAGRCSAPVVVRANDAFGNPATLALPTTVTLGSPSAGFALYADAACTAPTASVTLAAGLSTATFYFSGTIAGLHEVNVSAPGLVSAAQTEWVLAAGATALAFTTSPQEQIVGRCSSLVGLAVQDVFGNETPDVAPVVVNLGSAGLPLYSDAACSQPISSLTIAANAARGQFFFKGSVVGRYTVNATTPALSAASQVESILIAPPDHLVFRSAPQSLVAGTCSLEAQVQSRDENGVPVSVTAPTRVELRGPAGVSFFSDASCTIAITSTTMASAADTVGFFFRGTVAGSASITAEAVGLGVGAQTETIVPGPVERIAFLSAPLTLVVNTCSPALRLGLSDALGNSAVSGAAVRIDLTASPSSGAAFFADPACTTQVNAATLAAGATSTTVYFLDTRAARVVVSATSSGLLGAAQDAVVNPGPPAGLVFATSAQIVTAGNCSRLTSVQSQDVFGNASVVTLASALLLTASPAAGFTFYADGSCTLPLTQVTFAAQADSQSFYFRGTASGPVQLTVTTQGWSATQTQTVIAAPPVQLTFDDIASPAPNDVAFPVRLVARDAYGNPTPSFSGSAGFEVLPAGSVRCQFNCSGPASTSPFTSGIWEGSVSVDSIGTARKLSAASGALVGLSAAFDVAPPPMRSAPRARVTASPAAVVVGQPVSLSVASSSDFQTSLVNLEVSWDFDGAASGNPPWSAWSSAKTVSHVYGVAGLYEARVAVRDADGDLGYASTLVKVVDLASPPPCTVTTSALTDDGATSCQGPFGTDGVLSLTEAVRLANAGTDLTITFASPMAITGAGRLALSAPMSVLGGGGVSVSVPLDIQAAVLLADLELTAMASTCTVAPTGALTLTDVFHHHGAGWVNAGSAVLSRLTMKACVGDCFTDNGGSALTVSFSSFEQSNANGLVLSTCSSAASRVDVQSSTFWGLKTGLKASCSRPLSILHATFDSNERAVEYSAGAGHVLRNAVFSRHSVQAVSCATATFAVRDNSLSFQNASDGCIAGDANGLSADPLFVYPAARDLRVMAASPAVDSAVDVGRDVNGPGPGRFFGGAPDRGSGEAL